MKKIIKYITISLLLGLAACEDFLKETPVTNITTDVIFDSQSGLELGVNALYNRMRSYNFPSGEGTPLQANALFYVGDDLGLVRTWFRPYFATGFTPTGWTGYKWDHAYQTIDRASAIIAAAPNIDMDAADRNQIMAEAKIVRAELYFDLIRMYDNILFDTIPVTPENLNEPPVFEVATQEEVFGAIVSDLDFAVEHLNWSVPAGRYGKGVAKHLRGKVAMWLGDWDEAVEQFDDIIEDPTHDLVALNAVFAQEANHKEALFVYQRDRLLPLGDNNAGGGGTWIGSMFVNRLYEMSGAQVLATVEGGGQALGWAYPNDYLKSLYDQENDLRFITYYYPLKITNNNPNHPNFGQEITYDNDYRRYHWSLKKFYDADKNILSNDSWKDLIYYRYAETLLLAAESHWRASGSDTDPKALEYINKIRRRAFGVNNDTYDFTTFTLDTYLEEHARELAFEKHRWFDLKRMGILVERQNAHYMYGSNTGNQKLEPMAPHMKTLPIPQSAIDKMGDSFPQNDGYF